MCCAGLVKSVLGLKGIPCYFLVIGIRGIIVIVVTGAVYVGEIATYVVLVWCSQS